MEIDPIKYGAMHQKVEDYDRRFAEVSVKISKMEKHLEDILAAINQSKGGMWIGKFIVGTISGAGVLFVEWVTRK